MFTTIIIQPIFNMLVLIYALIPGHNFGLAIILFTILIRILLYPLLKKQLHHAKAMRALAPELKKIKAAAAGNRQKESMLTMELYKEREVNPFSSLGVVLVQIPILIGLYLSLQKIIKDPNQIYNFSYPFLHHLGWLQALANDVHHFDDSLFGLINLGRTALGPQGLYVPALILAAVSAIMQYFQSRMLMPKSKDARSLRGILKEAGRGKSADQQEVSAAVGRSTLFLIPIVVFMVSLQLAAALPLYWFTSSFVAFLQQRKIMGKDVEEAEAIADEDDKPIKAEADKATKPKNKKHSRHQKSKKRRR